MTTQNNNTSLLNDKMVDMAFITRFTGLTDKWFYKLIKDGEFPKPIKLGRSSRWMQSEVEAWVQQRISQSRKRLNPSNNNPLILSHQLGSL